ncbi:MAG: hypothetical protein M5U15_14415 [Kiritimatiellae bacterium]|nr:hypothetical protein [Kiritimatiellia bacterium]
MAVPDIIGGGSLFPSLPHREGCEVNGRQLMEIQCGDGSWQPYKTNEVRILFRGMALNSTVIRDGESSH